MNKNNYPSKKVLTIYPLLGGVVGGMPFLTMGLLFALVNGSIRLFAKMLLTAIAIGFIPALLTAIILVYLKIIIKGNQDYFKVFRIGFLVTFLCFFSFIFIYDNFEESIFKGIFVVFLFAVAGGVSSLILATFILPKS